MRSFVLGCVGASAVSLASALSPSRMLLEAQAFTVDSFDLVDLSGVPVGATGAVPVDGVPQGSGLGVSVTENTAPTFGTYALPPAAASALSEAILELPEVPVEDANVVPTFSFPGPILIGDGGDVMPMTPASLPTVLDLTRSGDRFVLADIRPSGGGYGEPEFVDPAGDPTPDSTQLLLSQFVVHAPDGVFSTFEDDGIPYISQSVQFGVGSRICFLNSILLLQSCDGFEEGNAIFCCSESACRGYTQAGYEDLGFDLGPSGTVPDLQCAETNPDFMAPAPAGLPTGPDIPDDEPPLAIAPVLVADFSTWPGSDSGIPIITIDEERVGRIPIRSFQTGILPGAFSLSSSEASAINDIVEGLPDVPPEEAPVVDIVDFPGIEARGTTISGTMSRIPTVYNPFKAGIRAELVEQMDEETTVFNLSNMTFLVPNATYAGLGDSGLLNFFGLQDGQPNDLVCVQNSIFVLASCEGFRQAEFSLWCCNSIECNREFTSEFLLAVGAIQNPLDQLTCVEIGA